MMLRRRSITVDHCEFDDSDYFLGPCMVQDKMLILYALFVMTCGWPSFSISTAEI